MPDLEDDTSDQDWWTCECGRVNEELVCWTCNRIRPSLPNAPTRIKTMNDLRLLTAIFNEDCPVIGVDGQHVEIQCIFTGDGTIVVSLARE